MKYVGTYLVITQENILWNPNIYLHTHFEDEHNRITHVINNENETDRRLRNQNDDFTLQQVEK